MSVKQKIKEIVIWLIVLIAATSFCLFYNFLNPKIINGLFSRFSIISTENNLMVHFISVGEADAIAINLPDGKAMLIDTGPEEKNNSYVKYIKQNVLNNNLNNDIDYLFLTHADIDHTGGALKLFSTFDVKKVFIPAFGSDTIYYENLLNYIEDNENYSYVNNDFEIVGNGYKIQVFSPIYTAQTNDGCPLIRIEYMNKSFLFSGDISKDVELKMVEKYGNNLDCDVLKVAHHGSKTSTSEEFLNVITPEYAVISVGANSYGHPSSETLNRIQQVGAECLRTDVNGNILFVVGANYGINYKTDGYYLTNLSLDYRDLIIVIDAFILIKIIFVIAKKKRRKTK